MTDNRSTLPCLPEKIVGRCRKGVVRCWDFPQRIIVSAMPGPSGATTRPPAVAGLFYPAEAGTCAAVAGQLLRAADVSGAGVSPGRSWRGGIVPHAGWRYSGAIAAQTLAAIAASRGGSPPAVVVVFGAVHTPAPLDLAALATHDAWAVPGGVSAVPRELSGKLSTDASSLFVVNDFFHQREHAVEVELPLIQQLWPGAAMLPVEVPLVEQSVGIGTRTARAIESAGVDAVYLASSDLTHYGPAYQFAPAGVGLAGLAWAKENDRKLLDAVTGMSAERIVPEVRSHLNACGGGAIAAMLAACRERGIVEARVLRHNSSFEVEQSLEAASGIWSQPRPDNAVGYAAVVVG
jgi:AmmeMemoRadiSam system protein B